MIVERRRAAPLALMRSSSSSMPVEYTSTSVHSAFPQSPHTTWLLRRCCSLAMSVARLIKQPAGAVRLHLGAQTLTGFLPACARHHQAAVLRCCVDLDSGTAASPPRRFWSHVTPLARERFADSLVWRLARASSSPPPDSSGGRQMHVYSST
jgi:hypothetical protein